MSKIYLFGPVELGGEASRAIIAENKERFREARIILRDMGHDVFCPVEFTESTGIKDIREALRYDLAYILKEAQILVGLPGWRASDGSLIEVHLAWRLDIPVYEYEFFSKRILRAVKNHFVWNYGEVV